MSQSQKERKELEVFGLNLRRLREGKGLTQEKLAELADLHPRAVQKIEAGDVNTTVTTILRLRTALECAPGDFFERC